MSQEDLDIINRETKKEKYINFFKKNKKVLIGLLFLIVFIILFYFIYNFYKVDQKEFKWSGKSILKKIDLSLLPDYISKNEKTFKEWLD